MRVLITSFEPFGADTENASFETMSRLLARWHHRGVELIGTELPVIFDDEPLRRAVAEQLPDALVCLGEAGGRRLITPESRAANEMDARIADNAGFQPRAQPIVFGGEPSRSAEVAPVVEALRDAGWAAARSDDAGRYVCNFVAYHAYGLGIPAMFLHVPALRTTGLASVGDETGGTDDAASGREPRTFDDLAAALELAVEAFIQGVYSPAAPAPARIQSSVRARHQRVAPRAPM